MKALGQAHEAEPQDTILAWEDKTFIEQAQGHNLASKDASGPGALVAMSNAKRTATGCQALDPVSESGSCVRSPRSRGAADLASSIRVMHRAERLRDGGGNAGKSVQLGHGEI